MLLGSDAAKVLAVETGDQCEVRQRGLFKVSGVLEQTGSQDDALIFASLRKAQQLLGKEGKVQLLPRWRPSVPAALLATW